MSANLDLSDAAAHVGQAEFNLAASIEQGMQDMLFD
jgi:hypothetical protein